ncbi:hypothetical protein L2E82_02630 [Cichorium intybus]|uniref:Uncharacterized protein n=1 Tax=Cichorium intybus TaxID=13427 RepID=A0ACB9H3D2_CICIN|nr:hypothetical protein L2E82_02630 [Cichorium intybus]
MSTLGTYTRVHARHDSDILATHTRALLKKKSTHDNIGLGLVIGTVSLLPPPPFVVGGGDGGGPTIMVVASGNCSYDICNVVPCRHIGPVGHLNLCTIKGYFALEDSNLMSKQSILMDNQLKLEYLD